MPTIRKDHLVFKYLGPVRNMGSASLQTRVSQIFFTKFEECVYNSRQADGTLGLPTYVFKFFLSFISIQPQRPGWQEPEPRHVTSMALAHCILGKFLGVVCHCILLPLDVPTFAARCLYVHVFKYRHRIY